MSIVVGDYGNPIHGVSSQPDSRKFAGQANAQINSRNNLTRGCEKRAGFKYLGQLTPDTGNGGQLDNAIWALIERGDGSNFLAAYDETRPCFFTIPSTPAATINHQPFSFDDLDVQNYYQNSLTNPVEQLGFSNVLDSTFLTNRNVIPLGGNANDNIDTPPHVVYIEIKTIPAGTELEIKFKSGAVTYSKQVFDGFVRVTVDGSGNQTPDNTYSLRTKEFNGSWHAPQIAALDAEAESYNNWVRFEGAAAEGVQVTKGDAHVRIYDNRDIEVIESAPSVAKQGDFISVSEGLESDKNNSYFTAERKGGGTGLGEITWKESVAFGSDGTFDKTTMPHIIRRNLANEFTMSRYEWRDRATGDKDSNPYPSFILNGTPIQDIGLFQNRLYLTSDENVLMSATDVYEDLWRESAVFLTEADPFEGFANTEQLNVIKFTDQFDGDLVLFSDNGQFIVSGSVTQTFKNFTIESAAQYKADLVARPVVTGDNVFFATNYGSFAGVREFYTDSLTETKRARPITDHVNDYIRGRARHMATSTNLDVLAVLNDEEKDRLYVYEWRWEGNQRQQQAWSHWELNNTDPDATLEFEWCGFAGSTFYAVIRKTLQSSTEFHLWSMAWDDPPEADGLEFSVRLDGRFTVSKDDLVYNESTGYTTIPTLYNSNSFIFIDGPNGYDAGFQLPAELNESSEWVVAGDITDRDVIVGIPYKWLYHFGVPQIRDADGFAERVDTVVCNHLFMEFSAVGDVFFKLGNLRGDISTLRFNNRRTNRYNNLPSKIPYQGDDWQVPIRRPIKDLKMILESWSYIPIVLVAMRWRGNYRPIGRRV